MLGYYIFIIGATVLVGVVTLVDWLARHPGFVSPGRGRTRVLCTGDPALFRQHGEHILGAPLPEVHHIAEQAGRLAHRDQPMVESGQVTR